MAGQLVNVLAEGLAIFFRLTSFEWTEASRALLSSSNNNNNNRLFISSVEAKQLTKLPHCAFMPDCCAH